MAAAADIRLELLTGTDARVELAQTVGPAVFRGTTLLLERWDSPRAAHAALARISRA